MTTTDTPAALPATITLSKSNVRDFIRARGVGVPIILGGSPLKQFIHATAAEWQINLTKVSSALLSNCSRAGQTAAKSALESYIDHLFPMHESLLGTENFRCIPDTLPKYTVENAMIVGAEAAEKAIRPWVLGNAHHTNPNRQAAGRAAATARKTESETASDALTISRDALVAAEKPGQAAAALPPSEPIQTPPVAIVKEDDHHQEKTAAAVALADSEFESSVPFSSAGEAAKIKVEMAERPNVITLEDWLTEHGLRTMELEGCDAPWICLVAGLTDTNIASKSGMKAALAQGMVIQGLTELAACGGYAGRNKLPWPETLAHALEQQAMA